MAANFGRDVLRALAREPVPAQAHFLYNASREGTDIWCACREHFGTDETAAAEHMADVTPGAWPAQGQARRLLAEYRERDSWHCPEGTGRLWMDEAAELLELIAGEQ